MSVLDLPTETLLQILDESRPDGFEALCLTRKCLYAIATSLGMIQEHNQLKSFASKLSRRKHHSPCLVFQELIFRPSLKKYIRKLGILDAGTLIPFPSVLPWHHSFNRREMEELIYRHGAPTLEHGEIIESLLSASFPENRPEQDDHYSKSILFINLLLIQDLIDLKMR